MHRTQLAGAWHPHLLIPIIAVARQSTTDSRSASIGHATESRQNFNYDDRDRLTQAWTTGNATNSYNESYAYNNIGNLTSKAGTTYIYPAAGSARPHTTTTVGGTSYLYDANGNLASGNGRNYTWNAENLPTTISYIGDSENYSYDADGERVKLVRGSTTTVYLEDVWEEVVSGATQIYYVFNRQVVAVRDSGTSAVTYLHGDHLGSVSVATDGNQAVVSQQEFYPWGTHRGSGDITQTTCELYGILTGARTGAHQRARTKVIFALVVAERRTATIWERSSIFLPQRRRFFHKEVSDVTSSFVDHAEGRGHRAARRSDSAEHGLA